MRTPPLPSALRARPAALTFLVALLVVLPLAPARAADAAGLPDGVSWTVTIDGENIERERDEHIRLDPARTTTVLLRIENRSSDVVVVRHVRLEGAVLGLPLYGFTTLVDMQLQPGADDERSIPLDLFDLGRQASGLIPSSVTLFDGDGDVLDAKTLTVDVRGDSDSVYVLFGLAVAALATWLLAGGLWRLATGRLHRNRWRRGMALAAPGLALGFLITFSLSAFRVLAPDAGLWMPLVFGGAAIGFTAGYLSPDPGDPDDDEEAPGDPAGETRAVAEEAR